MSGIPVWAYPAVFILCTLFLLTGMYYGYERAQRCVEEEVQWAREEERARLAIRGRHAAEIAHDAWLAHEEQALAVANEHPAEIDVTGWTQQMAADMDRWIRENIPDAT